MKVKSIKKNYIYNMILTIVNMTFPLITAPYLSYVLGADNIGKVNYATSIINWVIIFASFGIPRYGIREIARNREDKKKLSTSFWNLILIQFVLSVISIAVYLLIIFNIDSFRAELNLYLVMVIMVILNIFSIDWFYQGIEEYGYITGRNIIVKIISIILILLTIKHKEQYLTYAIINIMGVSFNNILNYVNTKKYVDNKIYKVRFIHYLKQLRVYFMTTLVVALYTQLDQLFIGTLSARDLAFYVRSKTVQAIGLSVVSSLITVFIPRTAYLVENNYNEYKNIINKSINYIYILALPCVAGITFLAKDVMILLGGTEFIPAVSSLQIISILVLVTSIGSWQVNQILLPHKQENLALRIQITASVISVILNIILIPKFSYIGAAITCVITETFLIIVEGIFIKYRCKGVQINYINPSFIKYLIATILMSIAIIFIKFMVHRNIIVIAISIIVGPIVYFGSIILLREEIVLEGLDDIKVKYIKRNK